MSPVRVFLRCACKGLNLASKLNCVGLGVLPLTWAENARNRVTSEELTFVLLHLSWFTLKTRPRPLSNSYWTCQYEIWDVGKLYWFITVLQNNLIQLLSFVSFWHQACQIEQEGLHSINSLSLPITLEPIQFWETLFSVTVMLFKIITH